MSETFKTRLLEIIQNLGSEQREHGERDIESILLRGVDSAERLLAMVEDPNLSVRDRQAACWILGKFRDEQALPVLIRTLRRSGDEELRAMAAQSLGELGSSAAVEPLNEALRADRNVEVRKSAAYAFRLIDDKSASESLLLALNDSSEAAEVRGMAAETLADLGEARAVDSLMAALTDPSAEVRFWAAFALGTLGGLDAIPKLEQLADDNMILPRMGSVKQEASESIERIRSRFN